MIRNCGRVVNEWTRAQSYERYIGRWSRVVSAEFLSWLAVAERSKWLDVGCGTGELTRAIIDRAEPRAVEGVDLSPGFIEYARANTKDGRANFEVADAQSLPYKSGSFDAVVSGLCLNFVPDQMQGLGEMVRAARAGACLGVYLWDYDGEMQMLRMFWDAAVALDPTADEVDEGTQFRICNPEPLQQAFVAAGLREVEVRAIDAPTVFREFDDYWTPFLSGQAPAPAYVASLDDDRRDALRDKLQASLPAAPDGSISLIARAWAAKGTKIP